MSLETPWESSSEQAWDVREHASIIGPTKVGAAAWDGENIHVGCNVEHRYRSHDIHAETNALSSMIASGVRKAMAEVIAAERENFTPCGACMDWIFQVGGGECQVAFSPVRGTIKEVHTAHELMPHYPT